MEKPFTCTAEGCTKAFKIRQALYKHIYIAHDDMRWVRKLQLPS